MSTENTRKIEGFVVLESLKVMLKGLQRKNRMPKSLSLKYTIDSNIEEYIYIVAGQMN